MQPPATAQLLMRAFGKTRTTLLLVAETDGLRFSTASSTTAAGTTMGSLTRARTQLITRQPLFLIKVLQAPRAGTS